MNQNTLGERIKYHRKRLGLTQEQLAERMGVSAQAVSKWENNLSCPDISVLPELAKIFGISVDELLGREANSSATVHEAEPIAPDDDKQWHWEWHLLQGRIHGLIFGIFVLLYGGLLMMNNVLDLDVSWWRLLWTLGLAYAGVSGLVAGFSFFCLILTLAGAFFLLDAYAVSSISLSWGVLVPGIIILWGLSLLLDVFLKRNKKHHASIHASSGNGPSHGKAHYEYDCTDGFLNCDLNFGEYRAAIVTPLLRGGSIDSSFGNFTVDLSGCEALAPNCHVSIDNSFGHLALLVPERFCVQFDNQDSCAASIEVKGNPSPNPRGTLHLSTGNNFGHISIRYI